MTTQYYNMYACKCIHLFYSFFLMCRCVACFKMFSAIGVFSTFAPKFCRFKKCMIDRHQPATMAFAVLAFYPHGMPSRILVKKNQCLQHIKIRIYANHYQEYSAAAAGSTLSEAVELFHAYKQRMRIAMHINHTLAKTVSMPLYRFVFSGADIISLIGERTAFYRVLFSAYRLLHSAFTSLALSLSHSHHPLSGNVRKLNSRNRCTILHAFVFI